MKNTFITIAGALCAILLLTQCAADAGATKHSNKVLSEERQVINGEEYLVRRHIVNEHPLETYTETVKVAKK